MLAVSVVVVALVAGHSASRGQSEFDVDEDGHVAITIALVEPDLPELCDVDLGLVDPQKIRAAEERLDVCVANDFPRWLRLRVDDVACPVTGGRYRRGPGLAVVLAAEAACPPPRGHALVLDWGLFAGAALDHTSTATLRLPDGTTHKALLSRRKNKLSIDVKGDVPVVAIAAAASVVVVVGAFALAVLLRRRRRRQNSRGARAA
jgi:hypothetical protein